jgi:hypothetical protein
MCPPHLLIDRPRGWRQRASIQGCGIIPEFGRYKDLYRECNTLGEQKKKWCDTKERKCKTGLPKDQLKERLSNAQECVKRREQVADVFDKVKDQLGSEGADVKKHSEKIISMIKSGEGGHSTAISDAKTVARDCEDVLKKAK